MFVEAKTFIVKQGFSDEIIKKFSGPKKVAEMEGFLDLMVMKNLKGGETEEIRVELRFESQEAYKNWKKSDAHKAGHTNGQKQKPDYIVDVKLDVYSTVESVN